MVQQTRCAQQQRLDRSERLIIIIKAYRRLYGHHTSRPGGPYQGRGAIKTKVSAVGFGLAWLGLAENGDVQRYLVEVGNVVVATRLSEQRRKSANSEGREPTTALFLILTVGGQDCRFYIPYHSTAHLKL